MDKKKIPVLLAVLGIGAVALVYFLYFQPTNEEIKRLKAEDVKLQARIAELEALRDQRDFFIEETEKYTERVADIYELFPENVMAEDAIQESIDIEDGSNVGMVGIAYDPAGSVYAPIGITLDDVKESGLGAKPIAEETSESAASDDVDAEADAAPAKSDKTQESAFALMKQPVKYSFLGDLNQFERAALTVNKKDERDVISMVALVYDESTGLLTGEMDLDKYYVTGRNLEYEPAKFNVPTGAKNLFSTYKQAAGLSSGETGGGEGGGAAAAPQ